VKAVILAGGLGTHFVLSPNCLELINGDGCSWEDTCLTSLASMGQMMAFYGFWQPMDTLRDYLKLTFQLDHSVGPFKFVTPAV
jgi:glucose-1-phosphate cytidylyltransferase